MLTTHVYCILARKSIIYCYVENTLHLEHLRAVKCVDTVLCRLVGRDPCPKLEL
jgi:hypothetical protein